MSFIVVAPSSASRRGVRQQRDLAGVLDGDGDLALVLDGQPGHPAGADLAALGDELPQGRGVLVVDDLPLAERVRLLLDRLLPLAGAVAVVGHCGALLPSPAAVVPRAGMVRGCAGWCCGAGSERGFVVLRRRPGVVAAAGLAAARPPAGAAAGGPGIAPGGAATLVAAAAEGPASAAALAAAATRRAGDLRGGVAQRRADLVDVD